MLRRQKNTQSAQYCGKADKLNDSDILLITTILINIIGKTSFKTRFLVLQNGELTYYSSIPPEFTNGNSHILI